MERRRPILIRLDLTVKREIGALALNLDMRSLLSKDCDGGFLITRLVGHPESIDFVLMETFAVTTEENDSWGRHSQ
ncbi:unnamed protein product [Onchocerca flexuosa]|uniref:Uncharacterized protein n=1 Tax=Onchocerca flexuosa TaxID=387005 RepID=A0A183H2L3_9BILA|nr:unnamed protein product [Onchocerca flexuosa]